MSRLSCVSALCVLFLVLILHQNICLGAEDITEPEDKTSGNDNAKETALSPVEIYRKLLKEKRKEHRAAVTKIAGMEKYEEQYRMVDQTLKKMHQVMTDAKVLLTESGYMPGDPMPSESKLKEAFSLIVENTGLFGDILLKLPDKTHKILKKKKELDLMFRWSIGFCNETAILEKKDSRILNLAAQELGVIEKSENYYNPYKKADKADKKAKVGGVGDIEKMIAEKMAEFNKKMKKEGKGGPKLTKLDHTEL